MAYRCHGMFCGRYNLPMTNVLPNHLDRYQQALVEARCAGDKQCEAHALVHLGETYARLGETEQAQKYFQEALMLSRQCGETIAMGWALAGVGQLHATKGETRKAICNYMEALDAAGHARDLHTQSAVLDNLIAIYQEAGEPDKVSICVEHKLKIAAAMGDQEVQEQELKDISGSNHQGKIHDGSGQAIERIEENGSSDSEVTDSGKQPSLLSRLIGGTVFTGFGRLAVIAFSFANVLLATRVLPAEDYGIFVILRVFVIFLGQTSGFGLVSALPVFIGSTHDTDEKRRTFNTALYFRLLIIAIVSAVAIPLRTQIAALLNSTIEPEAVIFIPVLFLLETLLGLMQSALQSFLRFTQIGISDFMTGLANLLLIIVFVVWLRLGFLGLVYARCLALAVALIFTFVNLPVQTRLEFDVSILSKLLRFGVPLQFNATLSFVFERMDTILVGILLGTGGVAYYEIARKIPDSLNMAFEAYRTVYYPHASRFYAEKQYARLAQLLDHSNRLIAFFMLLGALVMVLFGRELVFLIFTSEYEPSVAPLIVLMVTLCFSTVEYMLGTSLVAMGDTTKPPLINIARTVVVVGGNLLFIPHFGLTGAALTSLVGNVFAIPLNVYFLRRRQVTTSAQPYVRATIIFAAHAAVYLILLPTSLIWARGLFVISFLVFSYLLAVITYADLELLLAETRPWISRTLSAMRVRRGET